MNLKITVSKAKNEAQMLPQHSIFPFPVNYRKEQLILFRKNLDCVLSKSRHMPSDKGGRGLQGVHAHPLFFWNCTLPGMFSSKFTFASFSRASKSFLSLALSESRRRTCIQNSNCILSFDRRRKINWNVVLCLFFQGDTCFYNFYVKSSFSGFR